MIKKIMCLLKQCLCILYSDKGGCGGQCIHCRKIVGYVDRETLRRYADGVY